MRVVGQYKGSDIRITGLQMSQTYGGFLTPPYESMFEEINWEMINVGIPQRSEKMWGKDRALHVMEIDHKKRLPDVEVIVSLHCAKGILKGNGSDLIMAWFQGPDDDPFAQAITHLKKLSWEEKAQDI